MCPVVIVILTALGPVRGTGGADPAGRAQVFLTEHCFLCDDAHAKKGGLDLSSLPWNPNDVRIFDQWVEVFDKVDKQKMPPPSKKRPDPVARA